MIVKDQTLIMGMEWGSKREGGGRLLKFYPYEKGRGGGGGFNHSEGRGCKQFCPTNTMLHTMLSY